VHLSAYLVLSDKRNGGTLYKQLRQGNKERKKQQYGSNDKIAQINIDERPEIVEQKTRVGDWEN
jgi:IS30 family transposase